MKINKKHMFPTIVYTIDNVLKKEHIDNIRKHILYSYTEDPGENWQSEPSLQKNDEYKILSDKIIELGKYVFDDLKYVYNQFEITDMWANVSKQGEYHKPHTHSNNILSGVLYIQSDQSANIRFTDPRPAPDMREYNDENSHICSYPSKVNTMLLFPSWLQHYVTGNQSRDERISISFNLMLRGLVGSETSLQSARF